VLLSILANGALGWWWLDPITGLGIAALAGTRATRRRRARYA
jgi:hypothetical protein